MRFFAATALLVLATLATSSPVAVSRNLNPLSEPDRSIEERGSLITGIYACVDDNWAGLCKHLIYVPHMCTNFPSELHNKISSIGPDPGSTYDLFTDRDCKSNFYTQFQYPGVPQLRGQGIEDKVQSYRCYTS